MNCSDIHDLLPEVVYEQLDPTRRTEIEKHVAGCPTCRQERAALAQTRRLLDTPPSPEVCVDLSRLYRDAAEQDARRARRWRRLTAGVAAAAAVAAVLAMAVRLEVRLEAHQVVLRWGSPTPVVEPTPPAPDMRPLQLTPEDLQRLAALEDQLRLMSQIVHALADGADTRDHQRQRDIARLRERIEELQLHTAQRWTAVREYAEALFTAKLTLPKQGAIP